MERGGCIKTDVRQYSGRSKNEQERRIPSRLEPTLQLSWRASSVSDSPSVRMFKFVFAHQAEISLVLLMQKSHGPFFLLFQANATVNLISLISTSPPQFYKQTREGTLALISTWSSMGFTQRETVLFLSFPTQYVTSYSLSVPKTKITRWLPTLIVCNHWNLQSHPVVCSETSPYGAPLSLYCWQWLWQLGNWGMYKIQGDSHFGISFL